MLTCSQELRGVERRVLLETLAGELPRDTIQYSSKMARVESSPNGDTLLELADGSKLLAQVSHYIVDLQCLWCSNQVSPIQFNHDFYHFQT